MYWVDFVRLTDKSAFGSVHFLFFINTKKGLQSMLEPLNLVSLFLLLALGRRGLFRGNVFAISFGIGHFKRDVF